MPIIKGQKEAGKFKRGERLTPKEAICAQCYSCTCMTGKDCLSAGCALYAFHPYRKDRPKRQMSEKHKKQIAGLNRGRQAHSDSARVHGKSVK